MSITIENPSLFATPNPLRQKTDSSNTPQSAGFADKFDKALGGVDNLPSNATSKAKELAQALTIQMLQSSLDLGGDRPENGAALTGTARFSSANAILETYRANMASKEEQIPSQPVSSPSQLQDFADAPVGAPVEAPSAAQQSRPQTGTAWLDPIISRASRKYGVDAGLIRAVIKAESGFNPNAVSHAGARGLMQLMPATARSLGVSDSFDPEQNVMGGTRFLKDMLQRYDGNVDSALAAYNWGPGNVDRRPDRLPRETREYLVRVKQLYASYNT